MNTPSLQEIASCVSGYDPQALPVLGAKIGIRPHSAGIAQRIGIIRDTLAILNRYFSH